MDVEGLRSELATRRGFASRVQAHRGLRYAGMFVGVLAVLACVGGLVRGQGTAALQGLAVFEALALIVVLLGLLLERWTVGPLHARYLSRGWVSLQVPAGLVEDNSGDSSVVRRDYGLVPHPVAGNDEDGVPVVLVGHRDQSTVEVEAAAETVRARLRTMTKDEATRFAWKVRSEGLYSDHDATRFFDVPAGMLLAVRQGHSPFVLVVPAAPGERRQRPRLYGIRTGRGRRALVAPSAIEGRPAS